MQGLPVGVQSFEVIRKNDLVYVDKTKHIYDLVRTKGAYYFFLSRPRRFGKSLLVSTLKELFLGNKHMFESLWITQSDYNWKTHHVIHLDFSLIPSSTLEEFRDSFSSELDRIAKPLGVNLEHKQRPGDKLKLLIDTLENVVILIDEYDRPLLQYVDNIDVMKEIQSILRDFYAIVKGLGNKIPFLFMTGITKFSKTSVFSGLNNLIDLTLLPNTTDLLGYTDEEIDHYFQPHMQAIAQKEQISIAEVKNAMKYWYNGYQFSKEPQKVYNPFSVLMYLFTQELRNFWFETGTPSFLVNLIRAKKYDIEDLGRAEIHADGLATFEVDTMRLIPLLLQTGYLTFKSYDPETRNYQLGYPNEETKASFKLYDTVKSALEQIHDKKYYQKFLHENKSIILVGAAFDVEQRNISDWVSQELE